MGAVRASRLLRRVMCASAVTLLATLATVAAGNASTGSAPANATRLSGGWKIAGAVPRVLSSNAVTRRQRHDPRVVLGLNLGLGVRDSTAVDALIHAASTPGSLTYGRYLSQAEYRARYAPTEAEVDATRAWLTANAIRVTGVSPDNLIVSAEATTAAAERAFGVSVSDYVDGERTFYSNDVAPTVPPGSSVRWITGLDDFTIARSFADQVPVSASAPAPAFRVGGYFPRDFQQAYNTASATTSETVGLTLWGRPLVQGDLDRFATLTASPRIVIGQAGANGIDFIPCSVSACVPLGTHSGDTSAWLETALDVESAHGVAPGSHLKYWLASTVNTHPQLTALEHALSAAANDPIVRVVSNSWGINQDAFDPNIDASLQHAAAVGKTFFFSSGDTAEISYPATSPYAVAVGGTRLNVDSSFHYVSESTWGASGTGCSSVFRRPWWQIGVGSAPTCPGRAEPDVAADADPATGAFVYVHGGAFRVGGTSLAAPLWAGMTAVANQLVLQAGRPRIGFAAPVFYSLGNNPSVYHLVFHDVTAGATGVSEAGPGWDQATGWGSPNLTSLVAHYLSLTPTSSRLTASKNPTGIGTTVVYTATVSPRPNGGTVTFRQDARSIGGCVAIAVPLGRATCSVTYSQAGTYHVQIGYSGNGTFSASPSNTLSERVDPAPPPPAGYWMVGGGGAVYAFGAASWRGNAITANVSHFEPTPSRRGYWIVNRAGQVYAFGDAPALGNASGLGPGESVSSLSATATGRGYWLFTSKGRALTFGDAHFYGDMRGVHLNQPVIGSVTTPSGRGYYMVGTDGGIFTFGDAAFFGSTGNLRLNRPVNGLVPTPTNRGYWLVASDGGIFAFGDASFRGSMGGTPLNAPVVGIVRYGNGYLMVGSDGGIFDFSDKPFLGSLAGRPLALPIVSVAS